MTSDFERHHDLESLVKVAAKTFALEICVARRSRHHDAAESHESLTLPLVPLAVGA